MTKPNNKTWKTVATLNNYASAIAMKENLLNKHTLVKIKRGYPNIFRIKVWDPLVKKSKNKEISSTLKKKKIKKGRNNRRVEKNVKSNEKICSR